MKILYLLVLVSIISGCVQQKRVIDGYSYRRIQLNSRLVDFKIIDQRDSISKELVRIPALSLPNQNFAAFPPIDARIENAIKRNFETYFSLQGNEIKAELRIKNASQEFRADWNSETEFAKVNIEIDLTDMKTNYTKSCFASGFLAHTSRDAKRAVMDTLYTQAFRQSINNVLNIWNSFLL